MTHGPRVLHVVKWYPHTKDPQNGIFVQKQILSTAGPYYVLGLLDFSGPPEILPEGVIYGTAQMSVAAKWGAFYGSLNSFKPDVVHFHCFAPDLAPMAWTCRRRGIPYLCSEHWSGYLPENNGKLAGMPLKLATWMWARAAKVLAVSPVLERGILALQPNCQTVVVPNIVEASRENTEPTEWTEGLLKQLGSSTFSFVVVADVVFDIKRQDVILEAFQRIPRMRADLHFVGGGPDLKQLEERTNDVVNVHVHGRKTNAEVLKVLPHFDALVLFSAYETFGVTALEGRKAGLTVISRREFGGSGELDSGVIWARNSVDGLSEAMLGALEQEKAESVTLPHLESTAIGQILDEIYGKVKQ